mgnify:CR=1 FL=1
MKHRIATIAAAGLLLARRCHYRLDRIGEGFLQCIDRRPGLCCRLW